MREVEKSLAVAIMAAGKGTRMNSDLPKVLHQLRGLPMITHVIRMAKELQPQRIIAIIGHQYQLVENAIRNENVDFAYQMEQLGTGHAIEQCRELLAGFDGDVLILSGDVPTLRAETVRGLIQKHRSTGAKASLLTADFQDPKGYGRVIRKPDDSLERIVEHKDASDAQKEIKEINAGIYIFNSRTLFRLLPKVGNNNAQGEYYLPDVIPLIIQEKGIIAIEKVKNYSEIQGVNTVQQLEKLNETANL